MRGAGFAPNVRTKEEKDMARNNDAGVIAFTQRFAEWLAALRERMKISQVDLADLLQIMPQPISRWENGREIPISYNLIRLLALATPEEREALIERGEFGLDDVLKRDVGTHLELVNCEECGRPMRVRDFTKRGWPAPPLTRLQGDPFAVKVCPSCDPRL